MVRVEICIGSACYVKNSGNIARELSEEIAKRNLQDKVELKGSFCMKSCVNHLGLGVKVNGKVLEGVTAVNAKEVIMKEIEQAL
ncbi:MAG: (2Fe-2S) ferredoxin domain-containing protein [Solobacterium sp.]|nr:(2Fe-2S) ferredoxin domain-containing protein [Solobacterium sp.]